MTNKQTKEFLQAIWCALNCATSNDEQIKIMDLMEKYGGSAMKKWSKYGNLSRSPLNSALKEMKDILKANLTQGIALKRK